MPQASPSMVVPWKATNLSWSCTPPTGEVDVHRSRPTWSNFMRPGTKMRRTSKLSSWAVIKTRMASSQRWTACPGLPFHSALTNRSTKPSFHALDIQLQESLTELQVRLLKLTLSVKWTLVLLINGWRNADKLPKNIKRIDYCLILNLGFRSTTTKWNQLDKLNSSWRNIFCAFGSTRINRV